MVGTVVYFPDVNNLNSGAALFTFGSWCYFITDCAAVYLERSIPLTDFIDGNRRKSTCRDSAFISSSNYSYLFWRSLVDAISSFSFLLGSIFLFPDLNLYNPGIVIFTLASAFGMTFRGTEMVVPSMVIPSNFWAAFCCLVGYIMFTVGSVLFLSWLKPSPAMLWSGVMLFLIGSFLFVLCTLIAFNEEVFEKWKKQFLERSGLQT